METWLKVGLGFDRGREGETWGFGGCLGLEVFGGYFV